MFAKYLKIFCVIVILSVGIFYLGYGSYVNIVKLDEFYTRASWQVITSSLILLSALCFIPWERINRKVFLFSIIGIGILVRIAWVLHAPTEPRSDYLVLYQAALSASEGDFSFTETGYFQKWVYQLGFVLYQAGIISIFGSDPFVLKLFNIAFSVGTIWIVYLLTSHLFNERTGRLSAIIYTFYLPSVIMTSLLTNQILAVFLFYSGFYVLVKYFDSHKWAWIFIGVLIALGHLIRPLGSFVLLAIGLYIFTVFLLGRNWKHVGITVSKFGGVLASYFIVLTLVSQVVMLTGISEYPLKNRDPLWKFVVGLNHETNGTYSREDFQTLMGLHGEAREEKELQMIENRTDDLGKVLDLFIDKFFHMWGNDDASVSWTYNKGEEAIKEQLYQIEKWIYVSFFIFGTIAGIGLLYSLVTNPESHKMRALFIILFLIGYAMIHLLIEIQTRYRFAVVPSLIIVQSYGIYLVYKSMVGGLRKIREV